MSFSHFYYCVYLFARQVIDERGHVILPANQITEVYILNILLLVIAYL